MSEQLWYRHPTRAWGRGYVLQYDGTDVSLRDVETQDLVRLPMRDPETEEDNVHPCDMSHMDNLADIALMNNLHQAPLLDLLRRRYMGNEIYTFTGDILISINPYQEIPGLYDTPSKEKEARA